MSNRLDPDQARHFMGPNLGSICLQRLSANDGNQFILILPKIQTDITKLSLAETLIMFDGNLFP